MNNLIHDANYVNTLLKTFQKISSISDVFNTPRQIKKFIFNTDYDLKGYHLKGNSSPRDNRYKKAWQQIYNKYKDENRDMDELFREWAKWRQEQSVVLYGITKRGKTVPIEGRTKGNCRYAVAMASKIRDICSAFAEDGRFNLFLTLTYSPKDSGSYIPTAWQSYYRDVCELLEHLRKHYGLLYANVTESTLKGYPHAHIMLSFTRGTFPQEEKIRKGGKIKFGKLFQIVKSRAPAPQFMLEVAKDERIANYIAKYMIKASETTISDLAKAEGKLSNTQMKAVQELFFSWITNTRTVKTSQIRTILNRCQNISVERKEYLLSHSKGLKEKLAMQESERNVTSVEIEKTRKEISPFPGYKTLCESIIGDSRALIKLCTNSPKEIFNEFYILQKRDYKSYKIAEDGSFDGDIEWLKRRLQRREKCIDVKNNFYDWIYRRLIYYNMEDKHVIITNREGFKEVLMYYPTITKLEQWYMEVFRAIDRAIYLMCSRGVCWQALAGCRDWTDETVDGNAFWAYNEACKDGEANCQDIGTWARWAKLPLNALPYCYREKSVVAYHDWLHRVKTGDVEETPEAIEGLRRN